MPSILSSILVLYQQAVWSSDVSPHYPGGATPAAESTPAVSTPPAIARFLKGDHKDVALAPYTLPPPFVPDIAQEEVGPA